MVVMTICIFVKSSQYLHIKHEDSKQKLMHNVQALKEKSEQLSIHNKYTAVLAHEMRNFVTK